MRSTRTLVLVAGLALVACGDELVGESAALTVPPSTTVISTTTPTPTTARPVTTQRATTSTSSAPPTTVATTLAPLPVPLAPPEDERALEPRLELGRIEIPRIAVDKPLFEGISLTTLDLGPGHWPGTAMPGQLGNVVVAGHRTSHDRPFRHLDQLVPGDEVVLTTVGERFTYVVVGTEVVTPDQVRIIEQTRAFTATLFACHPPGSVRERIVVHLELVG